MRQNVMITGAGKAVGLGFNLVLRYLEAGDTVVATIRKPCPELDELQKQYSDKLIIVTMDISSTASVQAAAEAVSEKLDHFDLLINNAVSVSPDCDNSFFDADLDYIARTVDITAVGAMRVIKAFYPLLKKSDITALIMNISSEAGSISKCYRTNLLDYGITKSTYTNYKRYMDVHMIPFFKEMNIKVKEITGDEINEYYAYLRSKGLKGTSCQRHHSLIHLAFKLAMKRRIIPTNPVDQADCPKSVQFIGSYYNAEEIKQLIDCTKNDPLHIVIIIAAYYGLRRSEVIGLK